MKILVITLFTFLLNPYALSQHEEVKTYFKNGQLQSKGVYYSYSNYDKRLPKEYKYLNGIKQKDKEWRYWYENGQLARIENYKVVPDLKRHLDIRHGKWTYFSENGVKYREDVYQDGSLVNSERDIYGNEGFIGKILIQNGIRDTLINQPLTKSNNLIINSDFDYFFYKPVTIIYEGKNKIEDWLPYWTTPVNCTPDYISNQRIISLMNYSNLVDFVLPEEFHFVGIALYKGSDNYSEYIQGQFARPLIKGQNYCFKIKLALSSYAGYKINRIGFHFSNNSIIKVNSIEPTLSFSALPEDSKGFVTLCNSFIANGGEKYITIGRFSKAENVKAKRRANIPSSSFGLENSAYYLIDNVELVELDNALKCVCSDSASLKEETDTIKISIDLKKLKQGETVILKNVNFAFNSFELLPGSNRVLQDVLSFLIENPNIRLEISGHTDDVGSEEYNLTLSIKRAKAIYDWLINNGIKNDRLFYHGFGKTRPLYKTEDENEKALNRRVELKISTEQ